MSDFRRGDRFRLGLWSLLRQEARVDDWTGVEVRLVERRATTGSVFWWCDYWSTEGVAADTQMAVTEERLRAAARLGEGDGYGR